MFKKKKTVTSPNSELFIFQGDPGALWNLVHQASHTGRLWPFPCPVWLLQLWAVLASLPWVGDVAAAAVRGAWRQRVSLALCH